MSGAGNQAGDRAARLEAAVMALATDGRVAVESLPVAPEQLGLDSDAAYAWLPPHVDLLDAEAIHARLGGRARDWLRDLQVHRVIGSTSTRLAEESRRSSIAGRVHLAEVQLAGRGRRGRTWFSPLGGNLAVSLGFASERPPAELGGLSLVVGLGVVDALDGLGIDAVALKWPNDLLLDGAKLAGILIEVLQTPRGAEFSVGVGINVALPQAVRTSVEQAVADLSHGAGGAPDRSLLAGAVISSVVEFVLEFQRLGFEPFRAAFDARHHLLGREASVIATGAEPQRGEVLGVSASGGLRLRTATGVREFHGGEVSLRGAE
jgi:BirA family biotin operon repressor/biotin-[acetyl-CoA-carboxylase] ligase